MAVHPEPRFVILRSGCSSDACGVNSDEDALCLQGLHGPPGVPGSAGLVGLPGSKGEKVCRRTDSWSLKDKNIFCMFSSFNVL